MFAGVSQLVIGGTLMHSSPCVWSDAEFPWPYSIGLQIARVYALWNCNRVVLCLLGVISVIVCIISGVSTCLRV